ncbi:aspartyl protease family protein [Elizabethkingia anophelis]|uniref:aspartyl protease family protein n=1 Tax=Elizabethkingia anophelis TaxID=1117645 RepID=UPI0021A4ADB8|nr:aspartyl protease family protein [Elizabethkingia anophelis]
MLKIIILYHGFIQQIKKYFGASLFILFCIIISIQIKAQKGIFKYGSIYPKTHNENISFELVANHIFVYVNIEGNKYRFLVDTGAPTSISKNVKGNFELVLKDEITDASGNKENISYVSIPELRLGNLIYKNFVALKGDIEIFNSLGIDGILGANLICKSIWDFNIGNNIITVSDQINKMTIKDFRKLKTKILNTGTPTLSMTYFNKEKEKNIYFDTGYNGLFYLCRSVFEKLLNKNLIKEYIEGNGVVSQNAFGNSEGKTYLLPLQMKIGKENIQPFLADVDYDDESNLGSEWLLAYRTILTKNRMYIKKYKDAELKRALVTKGINISHNGSDLVVVFLWKNSSAQKKGIKIGDKILSINGKNYSVGDKVEIDNIISDFYKNQSVVLEINVKGNFIELFDEILLKIEP